MESYNFIFLVLCKTLPLYLQDIFTDILYPPRLSIFAVRDAFNLYMGFLDRVRSVKLKDACASGFIYGFAPKI